MKYINKESEIETALENLDTAEMFGVSGGEVEHLFRASASKNKQACFYDKSRRMHLVIGSTFEKV